MTNKRRRMTVTTNSTYSKLDGDNVDDEFDLDDSVSMFSTAKSTMTTTTAMTYHRSGRALSEIMNESRNKKPVRRERKSDTMFIVAIIENRAREVCYDLKD